MRNFIIEPETSRGTKYLVREGLNVFRVRPSLSELLIKATCQAEGFCNPWKIQDIFNAAVPKLVRGLIQKTLFWHGQPGYIIMLDLPEECCNSEVFVIGLTSLCSHPVSYPGEGGMVIKIKPRKESALNASFANSREFNLHSDLSYTEIPPDTLIMVVKNIAANGGGESLFSCLSDIGHLLPHEIYHQLRLSQFNFSAPSHYKTSGPELVKPIPIITYTEAGLRVRFRLDKITSNTKLAEEAVMVFNAMAEIKKESILLPKNSGVLINQRFVLHGRTEFIPTYANDDRELLRGYGTLSLRKYKHINYETGEVYY